MDIIYNIMLFLDIKDILKCKLINKLFHNGCTQQQLWQKILQDDYPNTQIHMPIHYETYKYYHGGLSVICEEFKMQCMKTTLYKVFHLIATCTKINNIPSEIGLLQNLKSLHLNYKDIKIIPTQIGQLTNLTRLDLTNNNIGELPTEIGQLHKLKILDLDNNNLHYLPSELNNLTNLIHLHIKHNNITNKQNIHHEFPNIKHIFI